MYKNIFLGYEWTILGFFLQFNVSGFYTFWWLYRKNQFKIYQTIFSFYSKKDKNLIIKNTNYNVAKKLKIHLIITMILLTRLSKRIFSPIALLVYFNCRHSCIFFINRDSSVQSEVSWKPQYPTELSCKILFRDQSETLIHSTRHLNGSRQRSL